MRRTLTERDLRSTLDEIKERFRNLKPDELFVLWFLRAFLTENEDTAAKAVSGGARDKGIDALLIDDRAKAVFVVQGKYRKSIGQQVEKRADVTSFAEIAHRISEQNEAEFTRFVGKADGYVAEQLREARNRVRGDRYRIGLFFVTTGKVTKETRDDAESHARMRGCDATLDVIDGGRTMLIFSDYLDGVAPPIPTLDLEMEQGAHVTVNGISQRYDKPNNLETWVFSMRGDVLANLFHYAGVRLFARNIRGFLGDTTPVNKGMLSTLATEPERFFYYNNGVTILCDEAERKGRKGRDVLQVANPQVINGQQTTRTLSSMPEKAGNASVLIKVIVVSRSHDGNSTAFDKLVSRIVAGTNWQNAISPSDLMANDRVQVDLERSLRKRNYAYLRKRLTKGEAKSTSGGKHYTFVKKEELAQAVAACDLGPVIARTKREKLFEEQLYPQVFPNTDPDFYLTRYRLMREVAVYARGDKFRAEVRWLVLNHIWRLLDPNVRAPLNAQAFTRACERKETAVLEPLLKAIEQAFTLAQSFYRENKGVREDEVDPPTFFKSKQRCDPDAFSIHVAGGGTRAKTLLKQIDAMVERMQKVR